MIYDTFYNSPKKAFFILIIISVILTIAAVQMEFGESKDGTYIVYSIEFEYFGTDSEKMEKIITVPLEEKIMAMNGVIEFRSVVQYAKSITSVYFSKRENTKKLYLAIEHITDSLYEILPKDVQKPRIYSSDSSSKGVLCIAFTNTNVRTTLRDWIDLQIKKKIESIDGVSEVIVSGGVQNEITVSFDSGKAALSMQNPSSFSAIIQDANSITPSGKLRTKYKNETIAFDTRIHRIEEIRNLPVKIGDGYTTLSALSDIEMSGREEKEIVRLNGKECIAVVVKSASEGNAAKISRECKNILDEIDESKISYTKLYDVGEEQRRLIDSVLLSLLQSLLCIILIIPIFFKRKRIIISIAAILPFSILWTLGILRIMGFIVNQHVLAGMSIALGLIADGAAVLSETAEEASSKADFFIRMKNVFVSLIGSTFTTIIVFAPLFPLDSIVPGVKNIAVTICIMILVSLVLTMGFVPCFIYSERKERRENNARKKFAILQSKIERIYLRIGYRISLFCLRNDKPLKIVYWMLCSIPIFFLIGSGKNLKSENTDNIIYCSVDYVSDIASDYIDNDISLIVADLNKQDYILFVRSECRNGSAELEIGIDKNISRNQAVRYIASLKKYVSGGFLYIPESAGKYKKNLNTIEIAIIGDDISLCQNYAEAAAGEINNKGFADSVILNFKKGGDEYVFYPNRDKLVQNGVTVQSIASNLRWIMFGPVSDKWIQEGKEYDIRILGQGKQNARISQIKDLYLPVENGSVILSSLGQIERKAGIGKIYRKNGRRAAYFTVEISGVSTDKAIKMLETCLASLPFQKGYGYSFSFEIVNLKRNYTVLTFIFILSIVAIFLLLTALTENIKKTLKIVSIIPASIVMPLAVKYMLQSPLELGDIVGMIILSGITVNNAIYIAQSTQKRIIFKIRNKIKSILVTSLTTIIGALPLLIGSTDSFSKAIAFFMALGVLNSLLVSLCLFPTVIKNEQ